MWFLKPEYLAGNMHTWPDLIAWKRERGHDINQIRCGDDVNPEQRVLNKVGIYDQELVEDCRWVVQRLNSWGNMGFQGARATMICSIRFWQIEALNNNGDIGVYMGLVQP